MAAGTGISPAELAALLAEEVAEGLSAVQSFDDSPNIAVTRVRVRVGNQASTADEISWLAELELEPRSAHSPPRAAPGQTGSPPSAISALPVDAITGISPALATKMGELGISTVGELAGLGPDALIAVIKTLGSRRVIGFAAQARNCAVSIPPDLKQAGTTVAHALAITPNQLATRTAISRSSAITLWYSLSALTAALSAKAIDAMDVSVLMDNDDP